MDETDKEHENIERNLQKELKNITANDKISDNFIKLVNDFIHQSKAEMDSMKIYRTIFDSMSEAFMVGELIFGEDGKPYDLRYISLNKAAISIYDIKPEQIENKRFRELFPNIEPPFLKEIGETLSKNKNIKNKELKSPITGNWLEIDVYPQGENIFAVFTRIINERKESEEREEHLKALMDNNPSLVFMKDKEGKYVYLNKSYEKQFIHSKDWYGKTDFDFWPKKSAELFQANDREVLESKEIHQFIEDSTDKDGTRYVWLNYKFPFTDSKGKKYVGGIGINATARVEAEEAIKESENKLKALFENLPVGISVLDEERKVIYENPALERILDLSKDELKLEKYVERSYFNSNMVEILSEEFPSNKAFDKQSEVKDIEIGTLKEDNKMIWTNVTAIPLKFTDWKMLLVTSNITERKKAEKALIEAYDNLEEKVEERTRKLEKMNAALKENELKLNNVIIDLKRSNEELEQFAYVASHDLQEPLRTIASFTQLLERRYKGKFDDDADEFMDYIVEAAVRMKDQIQGLLEYSRVATKGEEFKSVDMNLKLNYTIRSLRASIEESHAEITYEQLPVVKGDSDQLQRVFLNLISNAIKFRKQEDSLKVYISANKDIYNSEYVFSVKDNGIGIEKPYLDRIFTIFQRLHTRDVYEGTGMGLSIVKRIIERHGGRVWVESSFGVGSVFYFTLPIKQVKMGRGILVDPN